MSEQVAVAQEADAQVAAVEKRTENEDLDTLLAQFENGTKTTESVSPPEPKVPDIIKLKDQVKAELKAEQEHENAIKSLVKSVRGEVPEDKFSDEEIDDWLNGQAKRNPQLAQAWMQRSKNPTAWNKIVSGLQEKFNGKWNGRKIDPEATADHEAVAQAVRGASQRVAADPAPDFGKMSQAEFENWKRENIKY